jgi:hypothetical protein
MEPVKFFLSSPPPCVGKHFFEIFFNFFPAMRRECFRYADAGAGAPFVKRGMPRRRGPKLQATKSPL